MIKQVLAVSVFGLALCMLVGCGGMPEDAMQVNAESLHKRQAQTRKYDTLDETEILSASMAVLQDMGFIISETDSKLGMVVGSKTRETDNKGQQFAIVMLRALAGDTRTDGIDAEHEIRVSIVTLPDKNSKNTAVRVTFQRKVWDMEGTLHKMETISEPELYTGFFEKLSKSIFLEANKV